MPANQYNRFDGDETYEKIYDVTCSVGQYNTLVLNRWGQTLLDRIGSVSTDKEPQLPKLTAYPDFNPMHEAFTIFFDGSNENTFMGAIWPMSRLPEFLPAMSSKNER